MSLANFRTLLSTAKHILQNSRAVAKVLPTTSYFVSSQQSIVCNKCMTCASFHTSTRKYDLMEFFDNKKNWGEETVVTGRPWKLDELRIKSNEDLHKLWYVCLKERNMLMTMEEEYTRECLLFPNPERIFKVEETMRNIMEVIKERERAINILETGEMGEPKVRTAMNFLGMRYNRTEKEHLFPWYMNTKYKMLHPKYEKWMTKYLKLHREKELKMKHRERRKKIRFQEMLLDKFPHLTQDDLEYAWKQETEERNRLRSYNLSAKE